MNSSFEQVINGVDVFEVGYQQVLDFLKSGRIGFSGGYVCRNTYLIISRHVTFGHLGLISIWAGYSFDEVFNCLPDMYYDYMERSVPLDYRYCREYEVWHVVDDGDLWQAWDLEADAACGDVRAALSMYELFGIDKYLMKPKCLLCETARGPFLVVELREGTRNMCYQCYDAINMFRVTMGYRPLRYITL